MIKRLFKILLLSLSLSSISQEIDTLKTIKMEEVVVNSRTNVKSLPFTIIKVDSIKNYFSQETPFVFSKTPSILSQSDNGTPFGYSYLSLRGMGQSRINYTLNGMPLNDGEDLSVYTSNYTDILNSINSVQIIRGSGVSSNGASSYIGLINMELDSPFSKRSTEISAMYGSFYSNKFSLKYFNGVKKNIGYNLRISSTNTDGFRYDSSGRSLSLSGSVGYKKETYSVKFNTIQGLTKNGQSWLGVLEGMDHRYNSLSEDFNIKPQYDNFRQGIYQLESTIRVFNKTDINSSAYLSTINGNYDMPDFINMGYTNNLELNSYNLGGFINIKSYGNFFTTNTGINSNKFKREHIGIFEVDNKLNYVNNGYKFDTSVFNKTSVQTNNINIDGDIQIRNAKFDYIGGEINSNIFNYSFLNYSIGLSTIKGTIRPYFNLSKSGRETTRTNLFTNGDNLTDMSQVSGVKPEYVTDVEVGFKFNGKIKGSFNFYHMSFKDEIVLIGQLNSMGISMGRNVDRSRRLGIEVDINATLYKGLILSSNMNFSENSIYENNITTEPIQTPNFITNIGLIYNINKFNIATQYKYVKKSFLDTENNFILPEYHLLDINLNYNINKFDIGIMVNNILNRNWATGGYADQFGRNFYYTSGLNSYLTLRYKI